MRGDRGQALPVLLGAVALLAAVATGVGGLGVRLVHQQQARAGADAAALAAVDGGRDAAERLCRRNGCRVVDVIAVGGEVLVTVDVGGQRATARAAGGELP